MNPLTRRRAMAAGIFLSLCFLLSACADNDKAYLATPEVGDIYAAELTHFTNFVDDHGKQVPHGYGLLKVTRMDDRQITVITTDWYNTSRLKVMRGLQRPQPTDQWDESDEITINRSDLIKLREAGEILDVKRPQG